jgi:hypothetical protein
LTPRFPSPTRRALLLLRAWARQRASASSAIPCIAPHAPMQRSRRLFGNPRRPASTAVADGGCGGARLHFPLHASEG